jgi:hypothetical protein
LVDAIDSRDQAVLLAHDMLEIAFQVVDKSLKFLLLNSLNDKLIVMGEEKEATGLTR